MEEQDDFIGFDFEDDIIEPEIPITKSKEPVTGFLSVDPLTPLPIPPWVTPKRTYSKNLVTMLDEEILDFIEYVKPTRQEHAMRLFCLHRLEQAIATIFPDAKLCCFGSFETRLYLPSSDLDCVIMEPLLGDKIGSLRKLANVLKTNGVCNKVEVCIVKYVDALTNFAVDVSLNIDGGIETAEIVKGFLEDPKIGKALHTMMLLLKQFLVQRNLNEVFTGGLGSYALLCMITSFLRMHPKVQMGQIDPMKNIGILLIEFFELYGKSFNYATVSINLDMYGCKYVKRENLFRAHILSIIDPQDAHNDISRGSYNYMAVRWSFNRAFLNLTSMIGAGYEKRRSNKIYKALKPKSGTMVTLLGSVLTLNRAVLEQRDFILIQYERWESGDLGTDLWTDEGQIQPKFEENRKRKKTQEVFYVHSSSDEGKAVMNNKHFKQDFSSDDEDAAAFYKSRNLSVKESANSTRARLSDGIGYDGSVNSRNNGKSAGYLY